MKKILFGLFIGLGFVGITVYGASLTYPQNGGTGIGSATAGDIGKVLTVSNNSPFTYTLQSVSGSGGTFPFTVFPNYNSTTTTLGFLNGFFSTASSTLSGDVFLPSLSQGFNYVGTGGKLNTIASSSVNLSWFNNDAGFLTNALTSYDAWTHPSPGISATTSILSFPYSSSTIYSSFLHASTTKLTFGGVTGTVWPDFCTTITGSSALCDGDDATGGGGGSSQWATTTAPDTGGIHTAGAIRVGIGTTTPSTVANLTIASSTGAQLALSERAGILQWTLRNAGGKLYFSTTTVAGTATTTYPEPFTIDGNTGIVRMGYTNYINTTRVIPTAVNDAVDIGTFTWTNGAGVLNIQITVPSASYSNAKTYTLPIQFAQSPNNTWVQAVPLSDTGIYASLRNFALDIKVNNAVTSLRLRNTAGTLAGTAHISIQQIGTPTDVFTPSTATASVAAPTAFFSSYSIFQVAGNVGVNYATPDTRARLTVGSPNGVNGGISLITSDAPSVDWRIYASGDQTGTASMRIGANTAANYAWQFDNSGTNAHNFKSPSSVATQNIFNILGTASQTGDYFNVTTSGGTTGDVATIDSTGKMGIGLTAPTAKLSVANYSSGANTAPLFTVASSTGSGATSTPFIVASFGNIGIGSSTPSSSAALSVGTNPGSTASSTIIMKKLQWQGENSDGTVSCMFVVGTTPTVINSPCNN